MSDKLITKMKNLTKVFLFVVLGKLDPRRKKQFHLIKMTEMLTITNKYKSFETIITQMVDSMKNRFSKELSNLHVKIDPVDIIEAKDINAISVRIISCLINSIATSSDNFTFIQRKYLFQLMNGPESA